LIDNLDSNIDAMATIVKFRVFVWTRRNWSVQWRPIKTQPASQVHQAMASRETLQVSWTSAVSLRRISY